MPDARRLVLAGVLLGTACWIRYHGLNWAAAVFASAWLVGGLRTTRPVVAGAAVFGVFAFGLAALGLAAGDLGALTRDQAFNVYSRLVQPVNWFHLDREPIPGTIAAAIARDPASFWRNYLAFSAPHLWLALACAVAAAVAHGAARRFSLFVLVIGVAFVPLVNLGASPRGIASLMPLVLVAVTWAVADRAARVAPGWRRHTLTAAATLATMVHAWQVWWPGIHGYVQEGRIRAAGAKAIERILREDRVQLGSQVFSVADFYLVDAPGWHVGNYHPRIKGGWPTLDLPKFLETYPPPATSGLDPFLDDCQRLGVTHVVLSSAAGAMFRELGQLFDGRLTTDRLAELRGIPGVRIYRIVR